MGKLVKHESMDIIDNIIHEIGQQMANHDFDLGYYYSTVAPGLVIYRGYAPAAVELRCDDYINNHIDVISRTITSEDVTKFNVTESPVVVAKHIIQQLAVSQPLVKGI